MTTNILFIVIDSFNPASCYGIKKTSVTPNLDLLIKTGAYFTQAISSAPITIPSISSMLTSLYPFESTSLDNDLFNFNPNVTTYVQNLSDNGYETTATLPEILIHTQLPQIFKNNVDSYDSFATLYDGVGDKILEKLDSLNKKESWFYYVHLMDLHGSIISDQNKGSAELFDEKYGANRYERMVSLMDSWIGRFVEKIDLKKTILIITADHGSVGGAFDSHLEEFEENIVKLKEYKQGFLFKSAHKVMTKVPKPLLPLRKKLSQLYTQRRDNIIKNRLEPELEKLEQQNLRPLRKRIMQNMTTLPSQGFDEKFRIPLIICGSNIPPNKIIMHQIRSIDLFPTIYEIIGLSQISDRRGISFNPLLKDEKMLELPAYIDSATRSSQKVYSDIVGIRTSKYKYFRDRKDHNKNVHLYDLEKDPLEENNISQNNSELINEMEKTLSQIQHDKNFNYKTSKELTDEEVRKAKEILLKLGYI